MSWYMTPAICGLLIKIIVLRVFHKNKNVSSNSEAFIGLVSIFAIHNMAEIFLYANFVNDVPAEFVLKSYYALTVGILVFLTRYSIEVSQIKKAKHFNKVFAAVGLIVGLVAVVTNGIVAGHTPLEHSITAVKGSAYWIFQLTALTCLIFTLTMLTYGYIKSDSEKIKVKCLYALISVMPILIVGITVVALMASGFKINAMFFLPISSTLLILITLKTEASHHLTDIRKYLPYSQERVVSNKLGDIASKYQMEELSHKDAMKDMETTLAEYKLIKSGENITNAAKSMKMPRPTVYAILRRLGLSEKFKKK